MRSRFRERLLRCALPWHWAWGVGYARVREGVGGAAAYVKVARVGDAVKGRRGAYRHSLRRSRQSQRAAHAEAWCGQQGPHKCERTSGGDAGAAASISAPMHKPGLGRALTGKCGYNM
eukprot:353089-Chlamydomonas_euryale.AAC.2